MDNFAKIAEAQKNAPSYLELVDDGADFICHDCYENPGRTGFIVPYTPDGRHHMSVHKSCMDETWLERAKNMGRL